MADSLKVVTRVSTVSDSSRLSAHDKDAIPNSLQGVISKLLQDAEIQFPVNVQIDWPDRFAPSS
ncbi:hypothetical protein BDV3_006506 [Batrachochytrium dendrobatidis]